MSSAIASTVRTIKKDIQDICQSGNYYVTEELGNQFNAISNGLDHLNLDGYLMNTSSGWQKGFDSNQVKAYSQSKYWVNLMKPNLMFINLCIWKYIATKFTTSKVTSLALVYLDVIVFLLSRY